MPTESEKIYDSEPKTVKEYILKYMVVRGMFAQDANTVFEILKGQESLGGVSWGSPLDSYPSMMITALILTLKSLVVQWIDKKLPKAYYRPLFL